MYRSRWQVELLFKRFKQNFCITTIKAGSASYAETGVFLWLIIWAMTEQQLFPAGRYLGEKKYETEIYSAYEKCKVAFLHIKEVLCMSWSSFVDFSEEKYTCYLSEKKCLRNNQNDEFHAAILPGLLT